MRFNFPFSWYNKFGTIPSTYKEAMSYEEQILWLCKHQDDLEKAFEEFQTTVSDLETLVNSFNSRINQNAIDIAGILDSIVTTISESSTDSQIPSAKSVYDFVTNYTPQGIITPLESTITLDSILTLLNSGLYYTGNYVVRTTTGTIVPEEYTLMIPQDTLFYYDSTHDTFTLLYNYLPNIGETWLNEYWYWKVDTSGVVPDTSHWQIVRYSATDSLDFPDNTRLPSSKAVVDYVSNYSQVFNEASLTNGAYFNLSVPTFIGTIISAPEVASNTSYVVFDLDEIKTTKFRVTGECSNYIWFTTDINPLSTSFSPAIVTLSNGNIDFTNEIVTITKTDSSHYVVFNFDNTSTTAPSVEVLETELDITQIINSSSTEFEVPSAKAVYTAIQGGGGGGTTDYNDLSNKPSINSVTLSGNKTTSDLFTAGTNISFSGGTISSPVIYSTSEHVVGTWLNGKPLYEKILYNISVPQVTTDGTPAFSLIDIANNVNYAFVVEHNGIDSFGQVQPLPYINNAGRQLKGFISITNNIYQYNITSNGTTYNGYTAWAKIRYTKSTD